MSLVVTVATTLLIACADQATSPVTPLDETTLPGLVISEPRESVGAAVGVSASIETAVAYIAAAPGTFTGAVSVQIRNVTAGGPASAPISLHEGGFDPVTVPAGPGDQLELLITQLSGAVTHALAIVSIRRPPIVVRSNPPKGRTDVALSIQPVIVFSEPIDPQSLNDASFAVVRGGNKVSGVVSLVPGVPFMAEFIPDSPLEPSAEYELLVTPAVRDLDGDPLLEEYRAQFTTLPGPASPTSGRLVVSTVTTGGAFDLNGYSIRVTAADGVTRSFPVELNVEVSFTGLPEGEVTVELDDVQPNCSLSGESTRTVSVVPSADAEIRYQVTCTPNPGLGSVRLVFSRATTLLPLRAPARGAGLSADLWAMNADGSDARQLTDGTDVDWQPLVSPDGSRIAFTRICGSPCASPVRVFVMDANGSTVAPLNPADPPAWTTVAWTWLPDGDRIAIQFGTGGRVDLIRADGTGRSTLVNDGRIRAPAWSPDGSTIAFFRYVYPVGEFSCENPTGGHEIWLMNASGGDQRMLRRLRPCGGDFDSHLSWSRDGSRILFSEADGSTQPAPHHILWSMNADGSDALRLLNPVQDGGPFDGMWRFGRWSPDGKAMLLYRLGSARLSTPWSDSAVGSVWQATTDIYLLNVEDGSLVRVTADGVSHAADFAR